MDDNPYTSKNMEISTIILNECENPKPNFIRGGSRHNANIYRFENDDRIRRLSEAYERTLVEVENEKLSKQPSIEDFPSVKSVSFEEIEQNETTCSICHGNFVSSNQVKISKLMCGHNFHEDCILVWLGKKNNCPVCREKVE